MGVSRSQSISRPEPLSRAETQRKLDIQAAAAGTHTPSQTYTLADRFEARATDQPDKIFLIYQDQSISYGELNRRANRVAWGGRTSEASGPKDTNPEYSMYTHLVSGT